MRKLKVGRKFSVKSGPRKAMMKTWVVSLLTKERIKTTEAKAKEFRQAAERFITKAKQGDLASRRYLLKYLPEAVVQKLFNVIAPKFQTRNGGYTRIIHLGERKSDAAKMVIIELLERAEKKTVKKNKEEKK